MSHSIAKVGALVLLAFSLTSVGWAYQNQNQNQKNKKDQKDQKGQGGTSLDQEKPGQTLQPTALVHEAYLRLVGENTDAHWHGRAHFLATAALAMRHILIDSARRKRRDKRGDDRHAEECRRDPPGGGIEGAHPRPRR